MFYPKPALCVLRYEVHFRARRLRLSILEAGEKIPDPDDWLNDNSKLYQIGVSEFQLLKHTGGGGVFPTPATHAIFRLLKMGEAVCQTLFLPNRWFSHITQSFR